MKYKFYGWEKAVIPPIGNDYKHIESPLDLYGVNIHVLQDSGVSGARIIKH